MTGYITKPATAFGVALALSCAWATPSALAAQGGVLPGKLAPRPTVPAVTAADLMTRLYQFADDSMGAVSYTHLTLPTNREV